VGEMSLIKSISDGMKRFFRRQEKKELKEISHITMPKPQERKIIKRTGYTRAGIKKHPLHAHHFGQFSPIKEI
jgi:hypothetical protein